MNVRQFALALVALAAFAVPGVANAGDLLWDNDIEPNGFNGRALSPPGFPNIRVVDDFVISEEDGSWLIEGLHLSIIEDADWVPGDLLEFYIHEFDTDTGPGQRLVDMSGPFVRKFAGFQLFDRDVYDYWMEDLDVQLEEGHYAVGFRNPNPGGAGTNYWLTSNGGQGQGTEGWFSVDAGQRWMEEGPDWDHAFEIRGLGATRVNAPPIAFEVTRGVYVKGGLFSLMESDDRYLIVAARRPPSVSQPSIQVVVDGQVPLGPVRRFQFLVEASTTNEQPIQWIDLYNFDTDQWERLDIRPAMPNDTVVVIAVKEDPGRFVDDTTGAVRARVSFYDPGIPIAGWFGRFDQMGWLVFLE